MSTTAEVLIKSRDQYSRMTEEAKRKILELGRATKESMSASKESADILKDTLGIELPRELTKLIAHSQLLRPVLSAAFSGVALFGFIAAARQIPELFDQLLEAVTGWDEKAKKAFENVQEYNRKTVERLEDLKAKLIEISTISIDPFAGREKALDQRIEEKKQELGRYQKGIAGTQGDINTLTGSQGQLFAKLGLSTIKDGQVTIGGSGGRTLGELRSDLTDLEKKALDAKTALDGLNDQLATLKGESSAVGERARFDLRRIIGADLSAHDMPLRGGLSIPPLIIPQIDPLTGEWHTPSTLPGSLRVDPFAEEQYQFSKNLNRSIDADLRVLPLQRSAIPVRPLIEPALTPSGGLHIPATLPNGSIDPFAEQKWEELQKRQKEFVTSFREGAGTVWDEFFTKGQGVLTSLSNLAKDLLNFVGKRLFEDVATGLFFGSNKFGSGTGILGGLNFGSGLFGKLLGGVNSGPWSEKIPGLGGGGLLGSFGSGGGLLGGLFGSGGATGLQGLGGLLGIQSFSGTGLGFTGGGLAGSLGLGGGAGIFGLGALAIPVIGAAVAGAVFGLTKLFHHHQQAPFTRDPNDYRSREFFFYSGAQAIQDFRRDFQKVFGNTTISTVTPQVLVANGMPIAMQSNTFTRNISNMTANGDS